MRKLLPILLLICAVALVGQSAKQPFRTGAPAANAVQIHPVPAGFKFPNGQSYEYKGEWRVFEAGDAKLRMDAAGAQQSVVASADSTGFVSHLFHVHDRFESIFDPHTHCSIRFTKHIEEGSRVRDINIRYDNAAKKSILEQKVASTGESKRVENDTPGCVTDVISGIFYIATLKLDPGMTYDFPLNDGGKTIDVHLQVEARETVKTEAGTFNTVRVKPEGGSGKSSFWIWYTDDAAHIPVRMRGKMVWGTLTFTLKRVEQAPFSGRPGTTVSGSAR